ncbi:MAG: amylo-alpha-1,6-glucosidase [Candidatus Krumholzibacteriia bacterium]
MTRSTACSAVPILLIGLILAKGSTAAAPQAAPATGDPDVTTSALEPDPFLPRLADLAITVTPEHPREFIFTDKGAAHLAGEAIGESTRAYHGFYVAMHELLDGWSLRLEDGTELAPRTAVRARVRPDRLERDFRLPGGAEVTETVTLLDRADGFVLRYDGVPGGRFAFVPRVDMRFLWRPGRVAYVTEWREGVLLVAREDRRSAPAGEPPPPWLAIAVRGADGFQSEGRHVPTRYPKGAARKAMEQATPWLPGVITGLIPPRGVGGSVEVVCAAAATADEALARARELRAGARDLIAARERRLDDLLRSTAVTTGVGRDDRALAWARISLDNLVMEQRGVGIYAGFHWFTTYWGRDSFIVLPGACIASGEFETARLILRSFASHQESDPASPRAGRLPNYVTVEEVQYAGVDGTWWFVRALDELWRRSGDDAFACEMAPVVLRAVEGALRHAVDAEGFLTHGDGETWMDAGGEQNPRSPRGDRAVELQALFQRGLTTAARLVARCPDLPDPPGGLGPAVLEERYRQLAVRLAANFQARFWVDGILADHLNPDGTADRQVRPNGLLAVLAAPDLFSAGERAAVVAQAAEQLVMPWGVRSLAAADPAYHARHLDLARHHYDDAYHNGDVWLWLSGAYVSALAEPRAGFAQTRMLLDEILDEGAAGTLQEIRDGDRAPNNDEFGGATSQAWSLSELLRTVADDYLGLRVDLTAQTPTIVVRPSLPDAWPQLAVTTVIGDIPCRVTVRRSHAAAPLSQLDRERKTGAARAGTAVAVAASGGELEVELEFAGPVPASWRIEVIGGSATVRSASAAIGGGR